MALRRFQVTIAGTRPLICSNPCTMDKLGPHAEAINWFTSFKRNRNEHALRRLEWLFSAYWSTEGTFTYGADLDGDSSFEGFADPILPASHLQRCIRDGATAWKLGKDTYRAIVVESESLIEYDGPRDAAEMYADPRFVSKANTKRGVVVARIRFPDWRVSYKLLINDEIMEPARLAQIIDRAGIAEGLGAWRPFHGRFNVVELTELEMIS